MKNIIHISDLHFGKANLRIANLLLDDINQLAPDLVVISGDLTQRALKDQFLRARKFIHSINSKIITVPGNHDIPVYNILSRFLSPYHDYKTYINPTLNPSYQDDDLMMLGINSATPYRALGGYVTRRQIELIYKFFGTRHNGRVRLLVLHHNMIMINKESHKVIKNVKEVLSVLEECQINIVLSGHLHVPFVEKIVNLKRDHRLYVITAGTAISTRLRVLNNSYNLIQVNKDRFQLSCRTFQQNQFVTTSQKEYSY